MKQLYNKDIYDVNKPVKSYWEKVSNINQDKFPKLVVDETCEEKYLKPQSPYADIKLIEEKMLKRENKFIKQSPPIAFN